jgi:hypothetical protein
MAPVRAATYYTFNLFTAQAFLYQDPYPTACTAASAMIMLNTIAYRGTGGPGFRWTPYRVKNNTFDRYDKRDMTSILSFARAHDTLSPLGSGSDAHGWRNALNYYGWGLGAMRDPAQNVYRDLEYTSFEAAVHSAVRAIAVDRMPVGIVSWAGRHAQVITGYVAEGGDPATTDAFTIRYVYLSDPLYRDGFVNRRLTYASFQSGTLVIRFQRYRETDSPYDDPYARGWLRSAVRPTSGPSEWYGRWVIIAPVRAGLPVIEPPPTPDPSPPPSPSPTPVPDPTPTLTPAPASSTEPSPEPSAVASPSAAASASPDTSPASGPSTAPSGEPVASAPGG